WGANQSGQVSGPNAAGGSFTQASAGYDHTCAVTTSGGVKCWGFAGDGRLGASPASPGPAPPSAAGAGPFSHSFTSGTGTPSGALRLTGGSLPPGLAISPAGVLAGSPTQ